jgi:hypothetical protein
VKCLDSSKRPPEVSGLVAETSSDTTNWDTSDLATPEKLAFCDESWHFSYAAPPCGPDKSRSVTLCRWAVRRAFESRRWQWALPDAVSNGQLSHLPVVANTHSPDPESLSGPSEGVMYTDSPRPMVVEAFAPTIWNEPLRHSAIAGPSSG